jgi:hypothetical protein
MGEEMTQERIGLFWHRENEDAEIVDLRNLVGIYRILQRYFDKQQIIFEVSTEAREFLENFGQGYLCVQYVPPGYRIKHGAPEALQLMFIHDLHLEAPWINKLTPIDYTAAPIRIFIHATCRIDWQDLKVRQHTLRLPRLKGQD